MSIVIGRKYKVDKERLKLYCDKYGWRHENMCIEYVTIYCKYDTNGTYKDIKSGYYVSENDYFYPEDCLIDMRLVKLKKILCLK